MKVERHFFHHNDWEELLPSDRIYRCYLMAELGQTLAKTAPPDLARVYREMARKWSELACKLRTEGKSH